MNAAREQAGRYAGVRIDASVAHLDRVFDYSVPPGLASGVQFGSRVRVRFAGRLLNGLVVSVADQTSHPGDLRPIERVLGPEPVLLPVILDLAEAVAERMAGTVRDVLRAAIPPRHARAESRTIPGAPSLVIEGNRAGIWERYRHGPALLSGLGRSRRSGPVRACWGSAPGGAWPEEVGALVEALLSQDDGGVIVVVPDAWDVERASRALASLAPTIAVLTADLGPERRYREFLRILRGQARIVIGTRASVFAPMANCRAIIVWQDDEESLWDPQGPYWNARDVAAMRSHQSGCDFIVGSASRSLQVQAWCEQGWMRSVDPLRSVVRTSGPIIQGLAESAEEADGAGARIGHLAWSVAKEGLRSGPVLVQVPMRGYLPALACQQCRHPAQCGCGGPLAMRGRGSIPQCQWCAALAAGWQCPACGSARLRAVRIGVERTAEEFGRAFPGARVIWSASDHQRRTIEDEPALVVATSGCEPIPPAGYAAVVILDGRALLLRPGLRAEQDAANRWFTAASLARPRARVVVTADHSAPVVQALLRWDASWLAARELADRRTAGLPPATRLAVISGPAAELTEAAALLQVPHRALGPSGDRLIVVADRADGLALARELRALLAARAAKGARGVRVLLDPRDV